MTERAVVLGGGVAGTARSAGLLPGLQPQATAAADQVRAL